MKARKLVTALLVVAMLCASGIASMGCATKRQLADLEAKVDQALSEAKSAKADATNATAQVETAEAAAVRAEKAAQGAEEDIGLRDSYLNITVLIDPTLEEEW